MLLEKNELEEKEYRQSQAGQKYPDGELPQGTGYPADKGLLAEGEFNPFSEQYQSDAELDAPHHSSGKQFDHHGNKIGQGQEEQDGSHEQTGRPDDTGGEAEGDGDNSNRLHRLYRCGDAIIQTRPDVEQPDSYQD